MTTIIITRLLIYFQEDIMDIFSYYNEFIKTFCDSYDWIS